MSIALQQTELDMLRECLLRDFGPVGNARLLLQPYLTPEELAAVPNFSDNRGYLDWTVTFAVDDGFKRTPPFILSLLYRYPYDENAVALIGRVKALQEQHQCDLAAARSATAAVDPFRPVILRRQQPLLGRKQVGAALQALARADDAAVFIVNGISRSGRSYTAEIIDFALTQLAQRDRGGPRMSFVELNDEIVDRYEAVSLIASTLVSAIDCQEVQRNRPRAAPAPPVERSPKWLHNVAQWLLSAAANTGGAWWFVLDRVMPNAAAGQRTAATGGADDDPVDKFIQILARKIARLGSDNQTRLVILGYDRDFPAEVAPAVIPELLPDPSTVGQAHVQEFFRTFFASRGGCEEEAVKEATSEVFARLGNCGDPLSCLNASIRGVLRDIVA